MSEWEIEKPESLGIAGPALEGVLYYHPAPDATAFSSRFKAKYGKDPNVAHIDSYDAAIILMDAIKSCDEPTPDCLIGYLTTIKDNQGAGGSLTFDQNAWGFKKQFVLKTVKDGKFVLAS